MDTHGEVFLYSGVTVLNTKIAGKTEKKWSLKIEVNRDFMSKVKILNL